MKVESITFLSDLEDVKDIFHDNTDVFVNLENGRNYVLVIRTPKNLLRLMENEKSDFLSLGILIVIVNKIPKPKEVTKKGESIDIENYDLIDFTIKRILKKTRHIYFVRIVILREIEKNFVALNLVKLLNL